MLFTSMINLNNNEFFCGGYTHELLYVDGPALDPANLSHYSLIPQPDFLFNQAVQGSVEKVDWVGTHHLRIKNTLGTFNNATDARGKNGLYKTVYSETIRLLILDPCRNSTVN